MFATTIAVVSLLVSLVTAWLTLFRRGTVRMTQPAVIYLGPNAFSSPGDGALPKVSFRALLFATAKRGRIIESLHVTLTRGETRQNFNIWLYGNDNDKLARGSGLFVGEAGIEANHHFFTPQDATSYLFTEGQYRLEVFAHLLGNSKKICLFKQMLDISRDIFIGMAEANSGVHFDWGPDSARYFPHVEKHPPSPNLKGLLNILSSIT